MKIAVFHNLPKGGAKRVIFEVFKRLSKKHTVDLFTTTTSERKFLPLKRVVKKEYVFRLKIPKNFLSLQFFIYFKLSKIHKRIALKIDTNNYDLVFIAHDFFTKSPYLLRFLKTPSVYLCHEPPRVFYEQWALFSTKFKYKIVNLLRLPLKFIDLGNVKKADYLLANSNYSKKRLQNIYKREISVLKHGVDIKKFEFKNKKKENFFLTVGGLALFKGYDFLIKSIAGLPEELRFPLVAVADDGRDAEQIFQLAKKLKVKLIVKSNLRDKALIDLYNQASLFLFAAHNEPLGLCVLEAMACSLPVVAVKEGGVPELFYKNYDGLIKRDIGKFSKKIIDFLSKDNSRLKEKLRKHVEVNWSWEQSVKELEGFFRKYQSKTT